MKQLIDIKDSSLAAFINGKSYIIQNQSNFMFGENADATDVFDGLTEMLDAHFFDEVGDLHIYNFNNEKMASYTSEEQDAEVIIEIQLIKDKNYKHLSILKAVNYDEYGQMYIEYTRPYKLS